MDYAQEFLNEVSRFGDVVFAADPEATVPSCPGWTMTQLFRHVGRGNRWSAQIVGDRMDTALDPREVREGRPPADDGGARQWLVDGGQALLDAVGSTGADTPVWTFTGPQRADWWVRRRLHEVLVHRADAALAAGVGFEVDGAVAADAISEWLGLAAMLSPGIGESSVHLHATEDGLGSEGEWLITGKAFAHEHAKADAAVRGSAADLLLITTNRRAVADADVEVFGDEQVLQSWLAGSKL
ncbi:maleylpyruvate isomerase family mycothiol-dependent enzyme [Mycolicibacterium confluentis]|uniref:Uncharacterized protein n=1 Tax=Mycolicibacterium confluentis TaxID=28047 RepID=A0A7I7Y275_9MYCO|nr:maleylpyruvate isomerase family mycothiol-dependent enzyme [Mycolicibacterium confluentis]MCV7320627.1 maleylpyruvate isomerase family mycothiol-dependent enzyme [Mycolicibacterium confluentis]ORV30276.1 hypothetical protein AWB99_14345 [Mycolicibacterium confluentis]BBZ35669.1 hypothetical protein MCNF_42740 [Mycolicibacterium confluentis]